MSRYELEGPEREPNVFNGTPHLTWVLCRSDGREWVISYLACAVDTGRPECMAFRAMGGRVISWAEVAVSYAEWPKEALDEVLRDMGVDTGELYVVDCESAKKGER